MVALLEFLLIVFILTTINFTLFFIFSAILMESMNSETFSDVVDIPRKSMLLGSAAVTMINNIVMAFIFLPYLGLVTPLSKLMYAVFN